MKTLSRPILILPAFIAICIFACGKNVEAKRSPSEVKKGGLQGGENVEIIVKKDSVGTPQGAQDSTSQIPVPQAQTASTSTTASEMPVLASSVPFSTPAKVAPVVVPAKDVPAMPTNVLGKIDDGVSAGLSGNLYDFGTTHYDKLPDFTTLVPIGKVLAKNFATMAQSQTIGFPGINDSLKGLYGIVYEGQINAIKGGDYQFMAFCDDGCKVYIDGKVALDYDGLHDGFTEKQGPIIQLGSGWHTFKLEYYQGAPNEIALAISWKTPGVNDKVIIPPEVFRRSMPLTQ